MKRLMLALAATIFLASGSSHFDEDEAAALGAAAHQAAKEQHNIRLQGCAECMELHEHQ